MQPAESKAASKYLRSKLQDTTPILLRILGLHGFLTSFGHSFFQRQWTIGDPMTAEIDYDLCTVDCYSRI